MTHPMTEQQIIQELEEIQLKIEEAVEYNTHNPGDGWFDAMIDREGELIDQLVTVRDFLYGKAAG